MLGSPWSCLGTRLVLRRDSMLAMHGAIRPVQFSLVVDGSGWITARWDLRAWSGVGGSTSSDLANVLSIEGEHHATWKAVGTIEPSWVFYLGKSIPEIDESGDWKSEAVHTCTKRMGLILKPDRLSELEKVAKEQGSRSRP